jgi:lactate dehydrogenase-like 2-hydroxyacid dehydrogenase
MHILYTQRSRAAEDSERSLGAQFVDKDALLGRADFISIHLPLTPETRHFIDRRALTLMKPSAVLVNTARGAVIDESALVDALAAGRLRAAGLDVYEHEPAIQPGLSALPNVVLAPHIGSATAETRSRMAESVARDVLRVLAGGEPQNPVNAQMQGRLARSGAPDGR